MLHPRVESGLKDDNKLLRDDNKHLHEKIDSLVAENARLYAQLYSKIRYIGKGLEEVFGEVLGMFGRLAPLDVPRPPRTERGRQEKMGRASGGPASLVTPETKAVGDRYHYVKGSD